MANMMHTLLHPIVIEKKLPGSEEIVEEELKPAGFTVTMRRPKARDLKAFDRHEDAEIAAILDMIAACSNLSVIEADHLDATDFAALGNLLDPRGRNGQATGQPA
jgi:hypothetical protein